ncbi:MAG: hypothetical protein RL660_865 [Bacteroidota bacterium]|jgi:hypothetical protein
MRFLTRNIVVCFATLTLLTSCFKPKTTTCTPKTYKEDTQPITSTINVVKGKHWFVDSVLINGLDVTQSVLADVGGSFEFYVEPQLQQMEASGTHAEDSMARAYYNSPKYGYYYVLIYMPDCVLTNFYSAPAYSQGGPLTYGDFVTYLPNYMMFGVANYGRRIDNVAHNYYIDYISLSSSRMKLSMQQPDTLVTWILKTN